MVGIPALFAYLELVQLGLDDLVLQLFELELLPAAVAHGDTELAGRKTITH
jgi:hypothetical protein